MANLYTSDLEVPVDNLVDLEISQVDLTSVRTEVTHYTSGDSLIGVIVPPTVYVENNIQDITHIRVYLAEGQVAAGEKIKIKLDD